MSPGRGVVRRLRVGAFALAAVGLASAAHVAGGGSVSVAPAVVAFPVAMLLVNLLAGRRRGFATLMPAMALLQVGLHLGFMVGELGDACRTVEPGHAMSGMNASMTCHGPSMSLMPSPGMLLAHLVAGALLVGLLERGEAALWALADWLQFRAVRLAHGEMRLEAGSSSSTVVVVLDVPLRDTATGRVFRRRGPPVKGCATV